ncbi:hypothetical protein [Acinetobacter baumannii]|uniref:hypothetical protein n=1 Tax=Acinetobacter baumannii TaxID=470 RepID=UPI00227751BC|nr:hypothetical protein [Acinetobacter baumannii]
MIEIESRELADIPVLHAYPVGQKDTPLPCVIFYHGFTSSSLVYSYFAVALAQAGLRVIMPDAPDHGSRFSGDEARRLNQFWQILLQSMQAVSYTHLDVYKRQTPSVAEQEGHLMEMEATQAP